MTVLIAPEQSGVVTHPPHVGWLSSPLRRWTLIGLTLVLLAIAIGVPIADGDSVQGLFGSAGSTLRRAGQLPWRAAPVLIVICAFHYLAAALALRSAAGLKLPLIRVTQVQLVAAAANRITPAGLAGAVINVRFLQRAGHPLRRSVAAVAILGGLGAFADLMVFAILMLAGRWVGISGGSHELAALFAKLRGPGVMVWQLPLLVRLALVVLIALVAGLAIARSRQRHKAGHAAKLLTEASQSPWSMLWELLRQPRRLSVLLGASASTTLLLAAGFAFTAQLAPVPASVSFGSLLAGYLIGGAIGAAVPVPAGVGATEAALVGVLVAGHMPLASAVSSVLLFRLVTFWAPALVGLLMAKRLRRLRAL
ncbi:MAG: integral rane protein [Mycobacterium sp.]|nr:integral rane protein [Mycobacterium sp.]